MWLRSESIVKEDSVIEGWLSLVHQSETYNQLHTSILVANYFLIIYSLQEGEQYDLR
jgi:hypothetical protein